MTEVHRPAPHNVELEQLLIGALLSAPNCIVDVADKLDPHHFYAPEYQAVYGAILDRSRAGKPINVALISDDCSAHLGDQGREHLALLQDNSLGALNAGDYAQGVRDLWQRRELIGIATDLEFDARALDPAITADDIAGKTAAALQGTVNAEGSFEAADNVSARVVADLGKPIDATPTGIACYDEATGGGLHAGRFYGIGGRFKSGKSYFLSSISYNMRHVPHVYLTLESGTEQIMQRLMARELGCNVRCFQNARTDPRFIEDVERAQSKVADWRISFRKRPRMTLDQLKSMLAQIGLGRRHKGVIVDYMQLVRKIDGRQSLAEFYEDVAQTLAEAAVQFNIWVIAAAQLNKENGVRHGEGMLLACDMAHALHKNEREYDHMPKGAWLECLGSRYTPGEDIGGEDWDALIFDVKRGPHFRDAGEAGQ